MEEPARKVWKVNKDRGYAAIGRTLVVGDCSLCAQLP